MKFAGLLSKLLLIVGANLLLAVPNNAAAQRLLGLDTTIRRDSLPKVKPSERKNKKPAPKSKAAARDTSKNKGAMQSLGKAVSEDSSYYDAQRHMMYLWGRARVTYEDFELDADFIRVDELHHIAFASGRTDPKTHRYVGRPIIKQKSDKPTEADSLYYNYETKKAKVYNPASEQGGNFVSGGEIKRLNDVEVAYHNVLYSTCNLPYPDTHFGIVITKGIAEKNQIISGPAYLEIANVPLPIGVPFAFFPKPESRASGIIIPTPGEDSRRGFYLQNGGYYYALNDNVDFTTTGSIYTNGSWDLNETARYIVRYKYQGTFNLSYASNNEGNPGDPFTKDFMIRWSHAQDPNASPGSVFSASVNAGTHSFYNNTPAVSNYSLSELTQNTLASSISYQRTFPNSPFNMTVNLAHSQDLAAKTVNLQLPSFSFNMSSINPFDSKERVGEQKWYQKISLSYTSHGVNQVSQIPEDELFKGNTLAKRLQSGFEQTVPVNLNLTVLKYFQFGMNATYDEYWNFQTISERYDRTNLLNPQALVIDTVPGFKRAYDYNLGASLSTKLYGMMAFKGRIRFIRHVMTPTLTFNYHPDFGAPGYGFYKTVVSQATVPYPYTYSSYSVFGQSAVGGPAAGRSGGIGLSIDNSLEAKVRAKSTDTSQVDKKITLLQSFLVSTFYNLAVDSFKLSPINFSGHTAIFNQKLNLSFGGVFDPYVYNIRDSISGNQVKTYAREVNRYTWQDGKLPKLTSFYVSADISLNSKAGRRPNSNVNPYSNAMINQSTGMTPEQAERLALVNQDQTAFVDFNIPWNVNLNYAFNYGYTRNSSGIYTTVTNTVQARGDVSITPKWKVTYYSDIDLRKQQVTTMQLGIYRDLHCWDLSVQWIPFGYLKMYSVMLRVRASILQDLKLSKRSDYTNNQYYNPYY